MTAPTTQPPADPATQPKALPKLSKPRARTALGGSETSNLEATLGLAIGGALLGYCAILLGWAVTEASGISDGRTVGPVVLYSSVLATIYAIVVSSASDVRDRIWDRAVVRAFIGAVVGAVVGAVAGLLSYLLFDALQQTQEPDAARFYLLRALAWAAFGVGIGLVGGIAERSSRKAVNGLIGGLVGGAIGGLLFHYVGQHVADDAEARLVGLAAIGVCTGAAIGLVEGARRQAWLRVLAGGLAGKEFILYHDVTTIGSAPKCHVTLIKDPQAAPFHAQIAVDGARRVATALDAAPLVVNGAAVRSRALRSGDLLQIGATVLLFQERD